mmetsp:Transcript_14119/g.40175  ORF Transcript_14119/g.40175 Transcript_14119/m.40175 type:complete len:329 (+) Transcript_14119:122-1108(+)
MVLGCSTAPPNGLDAQRTQCGRAPRVPFRRHAHLTDADHDQDPPGEGTGIHILTPCSNSRREPGARPSTVWAQPRVQEPQRSAAVSANGEHVCIQPRCMLRLRDQCAIGGGAVAAIGGDGRLPAARWNRVSPARRLGGGLQRRHACRNEIGRIARILWRVLARAATAVHLYEHAAAGREGQAHPHRILTAMALEIDGDALADPSRLLARPGGPESEMEQVDDELGLRARRREAVASAAAVLENAVEGFNLDEAGEVQRLRRQHQAEPALGVNSRERSSDPLLGASPGRRNRQVDAGHQLPASAFHPQVAATTSFSCGGAGGLQLVESD